MNKSDQKSKAQSLITRKLQSYYNSVQEEEIPKRFLDILDRLEQAEKQSDKQSSKDKNGQR